MPKIVTETLYSTAETAAMLTARLGLIREWSDTLADMRRGRQHLAGLTLLPVCMSRTDGTKRPFYSRRDIDAFTAAVTAKGLAMPPKITGRIFDVPVPNYGEPVPHWRQTVLVPRSRSWAVQRNVGTRHSFI